MLAAVAAFFLWSSRVSAFVQVACSRACWAFISSSFAIVKFGRDCPLATLLTMLAMPACPMAT